MPTHAYCEVCDAIQPVTVEPQEEPNSISTWRLRVSLAPKIRLRSIPQASNARTRLGEVIVLAERPATSQVLRVGWWSLCARPRTDPVKHQSRSDSSSNCSLDYRHTTRRNLCSAGQAYGRGFGSLLESSRAALARML